MPDAFDEVFDGIGDDFKDLCAGQKPVTVRSIDPHDGSTLATAENVTALKRSRRRTPFGVAGGEVAADQCRFLLLAGEVGFTPKTRDQIEDSDGVTWFVESVGAIGFGQLYAADVNLKRS